jgi:ryanodine receptor 2
MDYHPQLIDTSRVILPESLRDLLEVLAANTHEHWAAQRIADGWVYGPARNDARKEHPCLVPYEQLPDSEKEYDRITAIETLKAIVAQGYQIVPPAS